MCALFILAAACALALAPAGASVTQRTPAPSSVGGPARAPARAQPAYDARRARPHGRRAQLADETTGAVIATVVGTGTPGCAGDGGPATLAELSNNGGGLAVTATGDLVIADFSDDVVRKLERASGVLVTIAGSCGHGGFTGDGGAASGSTLDNPTGVALDAAGNLYIADAENFRVRMVSASTGVISTLAGIGSLVYSGDGGPASSAGVYQPWGIAVDAAGNVYLTVSARVWRAHPHMYAGPTDVCLTTTGTLASTHTHAALARPVRLSSTRTPRRTDTACAWST